MAGYTLADGDLVQTNILMTQSSQRLINTFHWRFETTGGPTDGPTALNALNSLLISDGTWFLQEARAIQSVSLSYDYVVSQKIRPDRWRPVTTPVGQLGAVVTPAPVQNVAVSLSRYGLQSYRGATGRVQAPGIVPADVASGKLTTTALTAWNAVAQTLTFTQQPVTAQNFVPVLSKLVGATGYSFQYITGALAQQTIRVMHRRTVSVGK